MRISDWSSDVCSSDLEWRRDEAHRRLCLEDQPSIGALRRHLRAPRHGEGTSLLWIGGKGHRSLRRKRWVRLQADEREQFGLQLARQPRELVREAFADDREELEERDPRVALVVVVPFAPVARDAVA